MSVPRVRRGSRESEETLNWVKCQPDKNALATLYTDHYRKTDPAKVENFTVFQAFFHGLSLHR